MPKLMVRVAAIGADGSMPIDGDMLTAGIDAEMDYRRLPYPRRVLVSPKYRAMYGIPESDQSVLVLFEFDK